MAREIDERVVEMRFDNKEFEKNAGDSITTLQKLKEALNFSKSGDSLEALDKAAKKNATNMDQLVAGVTALQKRFSVFGIMSMRAVENITDSLMGLANKGFRFVESAIVSGGVRRAMNLEKAHFQLQNIIGDETEVQRVMDSANKSVDGTAYSFDVAAKAASQFYASGITDMKTMDSALRGLSGTTATFSADYDQMAMIWAQVSGKGRVMGDELLQLSSRGINAAVEITKFMNGVNDGSIEASKSVTNAIQKVSKATNNTESDIRDMVSKGKINFEIFSEAMSYAFGDSAQKANETFDGALSNIKSAFARIGAGFISPIIAQNSEVVLLFGAIREKVNELKSSLVFDEAIGNTNALSKQFTDAILAMSKSASIFIKNVDLVEPTTIFYNLIESVKNSAKGLSSVISPIVKAFNSSFITFSSKDIFNITEKMSKFTESMRLSSEGSKNLHDSFKGVFDIAKLLADGFLKLLSSILPIEKPITSFGSSILELTGNIGRNLSSFSEWVRDSEALKEIYSNFSSVIDKTSSSISSFIKSFDGGGMVGKTLQSISIAIKSIIDSVKESDFSVFTKQLEKLFSALKESGSIGAKALSKITEGFANVGKSITNAFRERGMDGVLDVLNTFFIGGIGVSILDFINNLKKTVDKGGGILSGIKKKIGGVGDSLEEFQSKMKSEVLRSIATSIGILAASLFVLALIDPEKLQSSLTAVTVLVGELIGSLSIMSKVLGDKKINGIRKIQELMINLSISIFILSSALKKLSDANPDGLSGAIFAVSLMIAEMTAASIILSKYSKKVKTGVLGIIAFSAAIYILTSSVEKLGSLDTDTLTKGLISVGALLGELSAFMFLSKFGKLKPTQAASLFILAESLLILQKSVKKFGSMDYSEIETGLSAIGVILAELSAFSVISGYSKHIISSSLAMLIMAKALEAIEGPFSKIGKMKIGSIKKGLAGIGLLLAEIAVAMRLIPKTSLITALSLTILAQALVTISNVMSQIGGMSWEGIGKSLVGIAAGLGILAIAMNAMGGTMSGSVSLILTATALNLLVIPITALSKLSWSGLAKGILAIAAAFVVLGAAGYVLSPIAVKVAIVSASLSLLLSALTAFVVAISALGIAAAVNQIASPFLALASQMSLDVIKELFASIPEFFIGLIDSLGNIIITLCNVISESSPAIASAITAIVLAICSIIKECTPEIVDTILVVVREVLSSLAKNAPEIVTSLVQLIIGVINALSENLPEFISAVVNFFGQLFSGILEQIQNFDMSTIIQNLESIGILAGFLIALAALSSLTGPAMAGVVSFGILIGELSLVLAALGAFSQIPGLSWLVEEGGNFLEKIGIAIGKFFGGIAGGFASGMSSQLVEIGADLSAFMFSLTPFIMGASLINEETFSGVKTLAEIILMLTGAQLLKQITSFLGGGGSSLVQFGAQLVAFGPSIVSFSNSVSGVTPESVQGAANAAKILASMAKNIPSTGGLKTLFTGDNSLKTFGNQLVSFGGSIKSFSDKVSGYNSSAVSSVITSTERLISLSRKAKGASASGLQTFIDSFGDIGTGGIDSFADSLKNGGKISESSMTSVITGVLRTISSKEPNFSRAGESLMTNLASGISKKSKTVKNASKKIAQSGIDGVKSKNRDYVTSGQNAADGYIQGLNSRLNRVRAAARTLASASQAALRKKNGENSPAKEFISSGVYAGMGYVIGLAKLAKDVYKEGENLGIQSQKGTKLGLQGISKVFDSLDTDPVITPRVDLTGVQQSADNINRMFNRAIHTTVDAAGSISVMQRRNETSEILSALKGLELQASGAGGDSYYINGLNYSEDQNVGNAIKSLVGAVVVQGRV